MFDVVASFSGDQTYNAAAGKCGDPNESVTVIAAIAPQIAINTPVTARRIRRVRR